MSPARVLVTAKLTTFTRLTAMPDSAAPTGLPPVAWVWMPNRVAESTTCMRTTTPTAHKNSLQRDPPNTSTTQPSFGAPTGRAFEMMRTRPCNRNAMPRVVMNEGIVSTVRISPFTTPISALTTIAPSSASHSGQPLTENSVSRNGERVNTKPADRSISPQISSITCPAAMIDHGATYCAIVW